MNGLKCINPKLTFITWMNLNAGPLCLSAVNNDVHFVLCCCDLR